MHLDSFSTGQWMTLALLSPGTKRYCDNELQIWEILKPRLLTSYIRLRQIGSGLSGANHRRNVAFFLPTFE